MQATFIFDKPFIILKQSLCEAMKKKREYLSEKEVWSIEHKKLVGILLRVIKTLTAENIKTSTIQGCNDSHERDVIIPSHISVARPVHTANALQDEVGL